MVSSELLISAPLIDTFTVCPLSIGCHSLPSDIILISNVLSGIYTRVASESFFEKRFLSVIASFVPDLSSLLIVFTTLSSSSESDTESSASSGNPSHSAVISYLPTVLTSLFDLKFAVNVVFSRVSGINVSLSDTIFSSASVQFTNL